MILFRIRPVLRVFVLFEKKGVRVGTYEFMRETSIASQSSFGSFPNSLPLGSTRKINFSLISGGYLLGLSNGLEGTITHHSSFLLLEYDSFASIPWTNQLVDFVKSILAQNRVKLVGVCFGHQIIGRAMGAKVGRNEAQGWEVSVTDVDLTEQGKKVFEGKDTLVS